MKRIMIIAAVFAAFAVSADVTISGVSARQRWPWNNLVDVDFTIGGVPEGSAYAIDISATYDNGNRSLVAKTFVNEPIVGSGANRIVWNLGADYPEFKADDLQVTVTVTPYSDATSLYCVIDVSGGPTAEKYPVRYTTLAPVHSAGQNDPCKTTELWLKRVKAGRVQMGRTQWTAYGSYKTHVCTLTNDYYLGIFPVTQAQFKNIDEQEGRDLSQFTNSLYAATRPVDSIKFSTVRDCDWENGYDKTDAVDDGCIIAQLRKRTGIKTLDLPSEWQWEYACRAGTTSQRYPNAEYRWEGNSNPAENYEFYAEKGKWPEEYGTSYVDRYAPNPWGFYGMIGNVAEWCANWHDNGITEEMELFEPRGGVPVASGDPKLQRYYYHVARGGAWASDENRTFSYSRACIDTRAENGKARYENKGFRLCIPVREVYDTISE
jgi:formylglycine-generating enzyme required for sulfatase activity